MPQAWLLPVPSTPFRSDVLEELGHTGGGPVCLFLEGYGGPALPGLSPLAAGAMLCGTAAEILERVQALPAPWRDAALLALRPAPRELRLRRGKLPLGARTYVMGILNLTPDSFSDGGRFDRVEEACRQALAMQAAGADIIDIGGESTRHFQRVHRQADDASEVRQLPVEEELARVLPVLDALRGELEVPLSIDTYKWPVAEAALARGAEIVNDVTAGLADPQMLSGVARSGAAVVLMHSKQEASYRSVGDEVRRHLRERADAAQAAGIAREAIVLDPGFGFGKEPEHSFAALRQLPSLRALGYAVLSAPSRKSFLGAATGKPIGEREDATVAAAALSVALGADIVRVHSVGPAMDAIRVADRTVRQ
jgi:dihydropteroate synthase